MADKKEVNIRYLLLSTEDKKRAWKDQYKLQVSLYDPGPLYTILHDARESTDIVNFGYAE